MLAVVEVEVITSQNNHIDVLRDDTVGYQDYYCIGLSKKKQSFFNVIFFLSYRQNIL